MKKIFNISLETNIAFWTLIAASIAGCFFTPWSFIPLVQTVAGYAYLLWYYNIYSPNRPFEVALSWDHFKVGDIITTGRGKKAIIIKKVSIEGWRTVYKVKPYREKKVKKFFAVSGK
jgi:hypothetical protein